MYAVIFKAKLHNPDNHYNEAALRLRELAIQEYGCCEFISSCENGFEIAISYWDSLEQIKNWKNDKEHLMAQQQGKTTWYESYQVQITEIIRDYNHS